MSRDIGWVTAGNQRHVRWGDSTRHRAVRFFGKIFPWPSLAVLLALMVGVACSNSTPTAEVEPATTAAPTEAPTPATAPKVVAEPVSEEAKPPLPTATNVPPPTAAAVPEPTAMPTKAPAEPPPAPMLQLPNVADTVERVRGAVLSIVAESIVQDRFGNRRSNFGSGTGVIFSRDGLALTNNHVIEGATNIIVTMDDGSQLEAELLGADALADLAVLRIPGTFETFLPLNQDVKLRVGEWVIAIGNALALPGGPTVTVGVVSALGRTIGGSGGSPLYDLIQTDTVINPGNSGGPLISLEGNLVGINTAVLRGGGSGSGRPTIEGIGFAINMATPTWKKLPNRLRISSVIGPEMAPAIFPEPSTTRTARRRPPRYIW